MWRCERVGDERIIIISVVTNIYFCLKSAYFVFKLLLLDVFIIYMITELREKFCEC